MTLGELVDRVQIVMRDNGNILSDTDAFKVADVMRQRLGEDVEPEETQIIEYAAQMGFEIATDDTPPAPAAQMTMDPAEVLEQVYLECPRVLLSEMPQAGQVPKRIELPDDVDLPDSVIGMVGEVDVFRGSVTFTVYDKANDLDREIGPIDLSRFKTGKELEEAILVLIKRLPRILTCDFN